MKGSNDEGPCPSLSLGGDEHLCKKLSRNVLSANAREAEERSSFLLGGQGDISSMYVEYRASLVAQQ